MTETVWTVADYLDTVRERKRTVVLKAIADGIRYGHGPIRYFETEVEAWKFCVDRADGLAQEADDAARKADLRYRKCCKRLNVVRILGDRQMEKSA